MRLLRLNLEHYRMHQQLELSFAAGLNVLEGANESGKSTLAEAVHRALFLPVRSSGAAVVAMRGKPAQGDPTVALAFEAEQQRFELNKRFAAARGSVGLRDQAGTLLEGEAAEDRLAQLVGAASVKGGNAARLRERWGHLWVWQGSAGDDPLRLGADAIDQNRLLQQLQRGASSTVQSALDQRVLLAVRQRWSALHTETGRAGRAGSRLDQAQKANDQTRRELEQAQARIAGQQQALAEHQQASQQLVQLDQQAPLAERWTTVQQQRQPLQQRLAELQPQWQQGQRELQQRTLLNERLKPGLAEAEQLRQDLPELESQRQRSQDALQQALQQAETLQQWIRRLALEQQWQQITQLDERLRQLGEALQQLPAIAPAQVEQLQQLERQEQAASAVLASLVTSLEVQPAGGGYLLDGKPLKAGDTVRLQRDAQLSSADGSPLLRITPGGGDGVSAAAERLRQARAQLQSQLKALGVANAASASQAERQRSGLLAEQRNLQQQRGSVDPAALHQQLQALPPLPEGDQRDGEQLRAELDALVPHGRQLRQELNSAEANLSKARRRLEQLDAELAQDQKLLLQADTLLEDLQRRHGGLEPLGLELQHLNAELQTLQDQLKQLEPQLLAHGLDPAAGLPLQALQQQRESLLQQLAASAARLDANGDVDLNAQLELAEAAHEASCEELALQQRDAGMLDLLKRLLEQEQTALAQRYTAPLADALDRYLQLLDLGHSQVQLQFDSRRGFSDLSWQRQNGLAWDFASLSGGTRELLASALRLAIAEVLAPAYDGCLPVLFDDAFTNVDPSRWPGLAAMLQRAVEQGLQLLVLSCDPALIQVLEPEQHHKLG